MSELYIDTEQIIDTEQNNKPDLNKIKLIFDLYRKYGSSDYIGENVSQLQHALQCAHQAELEYHNNPEYILGAFLHDIGHLIALDNKTIDIKFENISMDGLGLNNHELIGSLFLKKMGIPEEIYSLGEYHVLAKRYLITTNPDYFNELSEASKETFWKQGGNLSEVEINEFDKNKFNKIYLRMRIWDDKAKDIYFKYKFNYVYDNINFYENMMINYFNLNN